MPRGFSSPRCARANRVSKHSAIRRAGRNSAIEWASSGPSFRNVRCAGWDHGPVTRAKPYLSASDHEQKRAGQDLGTALLFGVYVNRFEGAGGIVRLEPDQGPTAVLGGDLERHPLACSHVFDLIAGSWHLCTSVKMDVWEYLAVLIFRSKGGTVAG